MDLAQIESLTERLFSGDKLSCARLISLVENESPGYRHALGLIHKNPGNAYIIGITGPPGSGKSTMTDKLAKLLAENGEKVGIVAVDPTSPYSKGAVLGDRIRMSGVSDNKNVFIRSMGTRGCLGGLSKAVSGALAVLSAYGCTYTLVETVGVGQSEVDIAGTADTTLMVLAPGLGDDIQAIKAGVMEIGDVFAVNKADRDGAYKTLREVAATLEYRTDWDFKPPVLLTTAESGEGVEELLTALMSHKTFLYDSGKINEKRAARRLSQVCEIIRDRLDARLTELMTGMDGDDSLDAYALAETLIERINILKI